MDGTRAAGDIACVERDSSPGEPLGIPITNELKYRPSFAPAEAGKVSQTLCSAVRSQQLSSFTTLLQEGRQVTKSVIVAMCESKADLQFLDSWVGMDGDVSELGNGIRPLRLAIHSEPHTSWLLEHGADPNMPPTEWSEVDLITIAAAESPTSVVRLLLEHGADLAGRQALHAAANTSAIELDDRVCETVTSRIEAMRMLLEAGADLNAMEPDPKGRRNKLPRTVYTGTPLHNAVKYGSIEAVALLVAMGADLSAPSWSGHTPLQAARTAQRQDIIDLLERHCGESSDHGSPKAKMSRLHSP